jgi:hypothetical protein
MVPASWKELYMGCLVKTPATRTYLRRFFTATAAYIALAVVDGLVFRKYRLTGNLAYLLAVLPALGIVGQIVAVGLYLREEKDEFQRNLFIQCMLWGLGGLLAVTSVWGMLESYTHLVHLQPIWIFPIFWLFVGVSSPILMWRYR